MSGKGAGSQVDQLDCTPGAELPADMRWKAMQTIADNALDPDDCRLLLMMAGLLDDEVPKVARRWERR